MYSSNNDSKDEKDAEENSKKRPTNTPPNISNSSQSSSPASPTLLVIDDTSNSEDETINNNHTNHIPIKTTSASTAPMLHTQAPTVSSPFTHDIINGTVDQQRRRNSSIAKLLGGGRLHNQQYEEIHQQILDSQSAQNQTNDNGTDSGIQRSRSSITRTLLMNGERTNSMTRPSPKPPAPSLSKDFEYLIHREVDRGDNEHGMPILQRNNSVPIVMQNLNSSSNPHAQLKLKRKRPPLSTDNTAPFALHDPFEITSPSNNSIPSVNHSQNHFFHFDPSKRPCYPSEQAYHPSVNTTSCSNHSLYHYHKNNMNSSVFNQFNVHREVPPSNACSSSCHCSHYSSPTMPHFSASPTNNVPTRKAKSMLVPPGVHERPRQRSYSNISNQSDSSSEASSKTTVPLKKRLLDAYNNEHPPPPPPTSSL